MADEAVGAVAIGAAVCAAGVVAVWAATGDMSAAKPSDSLPAGGTEKRMNWNVLSRDW